MTALDNGSALAPQPDAAERTISHPKLLGHADNIKVVGIADEDTGLRGPNKNSRILAIIHQDCSIGIK